MKILSLITPHVVQNPQDRRSSSEHKLRDFLIKCESFLTLHRQQHNYHAQKGSKDIVKIINVTPVI